MTGALFRAFSVCRRLPHEAVIYRCFERLSDGLFFVQSADRLRLPLRLEDIHAHEVQLWELFLEASPDERGTPHPTIEQAVAAFDAQFGN
ncbi:MAG: hypothetical protein JOZ69_16940 [Myxococcales bacterium]|nr:hypothetical protein [Myxococcales bacterium]